MSTIVLLILVRLIMIAVGSMTKRRGAPKTKPLCNECVFAHIQFGACGRRTISCAFGGGVRPLKLDVLYCTDFRPRHGRPRPAIGFVPRIAPAKQVAQS
jgi:hypothetical protein